MLIEMHRLLNIFFLRQNSADICIQQNISAMKTTKISYPIILMMPFGIALLTIAFMLKRIALTNDTMDFFIGMLFGLSVVANLVYIILATRYIATWSRSRQQKHS
jgi:hypothetical protein